MSIIEEQQLHVVIQTTGLMGKDLENEINHLDFLAFGSGDDVQEDFSEWAMSSTWYVMGRLDGKLVSQIGIVDRTIHAGGQSLTVAGVGGVATHPEFRQRGFAGVLLNAAKEHMRQRQCYDFAMLFCSSHRLPFYTRGGFCQVQNPVYVLESGKRILFEDNKMVLPLSGKPWPEGEIDVNGRSW
jgi:GNAT superfamily N-acetyltransferase